MGDLAPGCDSHAIVVGILCPSIKQDLDGSHPCGVTLLSPCVVLSVSEMLTEVMLCPRAGQSEGHLSFLYSAECACVSRPHKRIECAHPLILFLATKAGDGQGY